MPSPLDGKWGESLPCLRLEPHLAAAVAAQPVNRLRLGFGMDCLRRRRGDDRTVHGSIPPLLLRQQETRTTHALAGRDEGVFRAGRRGNHRLQASALSRQSICRRGRSARDRALFHGGSINDRRAFRNNGRGGYGRRHNRSSGLHSHCILIAAATAERSRATKAEQQQSATAQRPVKRFIGPIAGGCRLIAGGSCCGRGRRLIGAHRRGRSRRSLLRFRSRRRRGRLSRCSRGSGSRCRG